jgi:hypothetical protein
MGGLYDLEPKFTCSACGKRSADIRPDFHWDKPVALIGAIDRNIKNVLFAAGLETVGEVRETSDEALLSLPDFGRGSVAHLRETLGTGKKQA